MDLPDTKDASSQPESDATTQPLAALDAPATRREILLFGLLILGIVWLMLGQKPRTLIVVPDSHVRIGVIT
jgi:hypothetical protein